MTYYEDLTPYRYCSTVEVPQVHNVGWLGKENQFPQGVVSADFVKKLERIMLDKNDSKCQAIVNLMRGYFYCEFCNAESDKLTTQDGHRLVQGHAELLIPHCSQSDYYFCTPDLIQHYITAHNYLPPKEFIDSILSLDLETEFDGDQIFEDLVKRCGRTYIH